MANILTGLANAAVKASPFAAQMLAQRKAADDADRQRMLQQFYQMRTNERADSADERATELNAATLGRIDAQTAALRNPTTGVKYIPDADGNLLALPTKMAGVSSASSGMPGVQTTPSGSQDANTSQSQSPTQAPTMSRPTGVRVAVKPTPPKPTEARAKASFKVDGADVQGSVDKLGNYYDAQGNRVTGKITPYAAPVQPSYSFPVVGGPDGPVVARANNKTGQIETTDVAGKPAAASGGSASLSPEDRQRMLEQARLDNQTMKDYEAKVLSGRTKIGTLKGIAGAAASGTNTGVAGQIMGIVGNAATGAMDPDYQRYITAQRSYGRIMGNLQSKRYTDHQAEIERSISGLQGNDLNGTIQYKQNLRDASLADVLAPHGGGRGGGPGQTAPTGNIDLGKSAPAKAAKKDYGIFTPPSEDDE